LEEHFVTNVLEADADFLATYGIQMKEGRFFSPKMPTDTTEAIVINEALAKYVGWNDPVGKQLEIYEARKGKVIGVMKDFHFASLRETVQPLAIILHNNPLYLSIKIKAGSTEHALKHIRKQWEAIGTEYPFDYFFMDEQLNRYYKADTRLLRVLSGFAGMAIVIACMGLFGLGLYASKQRTKEIGIRKVLGASVANITGMLSKDFLKLVMFAAFIAFPVSWFAMHKWLQDFAYRVSIEWWVFVVAAVLALSIAFITISVHAIKAAMANPVKSLRSE
jgi:putative ABC transport system permease protein